VLLFWSGLIFKRRRAEYAGVHRPSTIIACLIKGTVAIFFGYMVELRATALSPSAGPALPVALFLCGAVPAFLIADALISGGFRGLPRRWVLLAVACLCGISVIVSSYTGGLGYKKRIPDPADVKVVFVPSSCFLGSGVYSSNTPDWLVLREPENIRAVTGLHAALLKGNDRPESDHFRVALSFRYQLNNGRSLHRYYDYGCHSREDYLAFLEGAGEEADALVNPIYSLTEDDLTGVELFDRLNLYILNHVDIHEDNMGRKLLQALQEDMLQETPVGMSELFRPT